MDTAPVEERTEDVNPATEKSNNMYAMPAVHQRLANRVAIVTGSSSGLGRAIAIAYAYEGAKVICADILPEARPQVKEELGVQTDQQIRDNGGRAIYVKVDVSSPPEVEALVATSVQKYGKIDILVNNAGISMEAGQPPVKIHETPLERWRMTVAVNQTSVFLMCKYVIAQMIRQEPLPGDDRGWIINVASIYGLTGGNCIPSYCASKGAVVNLTRQIALDYADVGIHCNAICPGYTQTAIFSDTVKFDSKRRLAAKHPLHGIGTPQDIVGAAIFLASPEARWITGTALPVDGGYTAQ